MILIINLPSSFEILHRLEGRWFFGIIRLVKQKTIMAFPFYLAGNVHLFPNTIHCKKMMVDFHIIR